MNAKQKLGEIDRLALQTRSAGPLAGLPPTVLDKVSDTDTRIDVAKLVPGGRIRVELKLWEIQMDNDFVEVSTTRAGTTNWAIQHSFSAGPVAGRPTTYEITIPADVHVEDNPPATPTNWLIRYRARPPVGNPWTSDPTPFIIDRRSAYQAAPGGPKSRPPLPVLPTLSPGPSIDDDFIERNKTGMVVTFPINYQNPIAADRIRFYISEFYSAVNPDPPLYEGTFTVAANVGTFTVDIEKVKLLSAKAKYAYYFLDDGAGSPGNLSALSSAIGLDVLFKPKPVLEIPIVPLALTDKLIDLKDCGVGVKILLNRVANVLNDDEVKFEWNNQDLGTEEFGPNGSHERVVPYSDIEASYYEGGADTETDVAVTVKATLLRGPSPLSTSVLDDFFENIYYPGPINPVDPPAPNDELDEPHITSTTVRDVLEPADYNKDQIVTITLPSDPNKPVKTGQQIFGEYAGVRFGPKFLQDGDATVTINLPWATIEAGGLGSGKPLQWFWSDIGGVNENPSPITMVTNNAIVVELVEPEVEREYEDEDILLCDDLKEPNFGLKVHIPGNPTHLKAGRNVFLHAQGYRDSTMSQLSPGTTFKSPAHPLVDPEGTNGFDMFITPYDPTIRNIPVPPPDPVVPGDYLGWWKIWYTVDINGTEYPSEEFKTTVSLVNPRGEYCEDA
ncbi:hypothetical protein [Pseudomonas moraviensis]|uniref:Uncharacterized protein n=1 Tax=Pseudomonas moraviensis TaxID=321662 RepID=A0A7Y9VZX3_9PSED|nr:hypothetical protein [Pseudomonas moraviensis]NYH11727.1 hypothetical protein [Pseudomonas moraviensis]